MIDDKSRGMPLTCSWLRSPNLEPQAVLRFRQCSSALILFAQFRELSYVHASMQPVLITLSGVWPVPTTSDVRRMEKSPVAQDADLRMKI